tara:strand:- start:403 stop:669 length:267 start_codon:yes stop_codon:yes gene_type:complete
MIYGFIKPFDDQPIRVTPKGLALNLIAHKSGTDFRHQAIGFSINSPVFFLPEFTNKPRSSNDFMVRKKVGRDIDEAKGCEIKSAVVMM